MGESVPGISPPTMNTARRPLDSWKEIARYLSPRRDTVHRSEHAEGMPFTRHHMTRGLSHAGLFQLDSWVRGRRLRLG